MRNTSSVAAWTDATFSDMGDSISDAAYRAKKELTHMGRITARGIDKNRKVAADGLDHAASALKKRAKALPGGKKVTRMALAAAGQLGYAADQLRRYSVDRTKATVKRMVKNNPAPVFVVAGVIGFLVGRNLFSRH